MIEHDIALFLEYELEVVWEQRLLSLGWLGKD